MSHGLSPLVQSSLAAPSVSPTDAGRETVWPVRAPGYILRGMMLSLSLEKQHVDGIVALSPGKGLAGYGPGL